MKTPPPILIAEITPEWIELRRAIIHRGGYELQAGAGNTIEIRALGSVDELVPLKTKPNSWLHLCLPTGAIAFVHELERNAVLHALTS